MHFEELSVEYCTREQLGIKQDEDEVKTENRENSLFFDTHKNAISDITYYTKKFKCIKNDRIRI